MKNEMDVLSMDERQRLAWLRANRATLIFVGLIWVIMILHELTRGRFPLFLMVMVPVIALFRFAAYRLLVRAS